MEKFRIITLGEVLEAFDALVPNGFSREEKVRWLSSLDGKIFWEIITLHLERDHILSPYEVDELDTQLLVPEPFGMELYLSFLENQVDHYNGDTARYNNSLNRLSIHYREYARWYHRTSPWPKCERKFW